MAGGYKRLPTPLFFPFSPGELSDYKVHGQAMTLLSFGITSEAPLFKETEIAFPVKDDVIEKLDTNNLSGLFNLLRSIYVCRRGV